MKVINMDKLYSGPKPVIQFTNEAYIKMLELVHTSDIEVQWHGLINKEDEHTYTVYDILVYPQIATAMTVTSDDEAYAMWMMNLTNIQVNDLRLQGHSHVNMGVSPSGTDLKTFDDFLTQVNDYYIFFIVNKKYDIHVRLYDVEHNILFMNDEITIKTPSTWGKDQLKEYVRTIKPKRRGINNRIHSKAIPDKGALADGHEEIPRVLRSK